MKKELEGHFNWVAEYLFEQAHFFRQVWFFSHMTNVSIGNFFRYDKTSESDRHYKSKEFDDEIKKDAEKTYQEIIEAGNKPFFQQPLKELALVFLDFVFSQDEEDFPFNVNVKGTMNVAATECYMLSIVYKNLFQYAEILKKNGTGFEEFMNVIEQKKIEILSNGNQFLGFWHSKDDFNISRTMKAKETKRAKSPFEEIKKIYESMKQKDLSDRATARHIKAQGVDLSERQIIRHLKIIR